MEFDNALRRQVFSLPELLRTQYEDLEPKVRKIMTTPELFSVQRIVLTGCGDSYAASMATKHAFEALTGIPTEVVPAIELSRFYAASQLGFAPRNPLVIAVSNSGKVTRVCEAMERAVSKGAFALAFTGNLNSPLAQRSTRALKLDVPPFESAPGTRSYMVSVLALLLFAIRLGEVRGRYTMDTAMAYRYAIRDLADDLEEKLPGMDASILETAKAWTEMEAFDFVGAGPDYAAAWFGHAKVYEAIGKYAMHINTEEWLHLNFFMRNVERIATVVVHSDGSAALSRTQEMLKYMQEMGRPAIVITDAAEQLPITQAKVVEVPKPKYPMLAPLVQFAPICLLAGYLLVLLGEEDGRGCKGPWAFCAGGRALQESKVELI